MLKNSFQQLLPLGLALLLLATACKKENKADSQAGATQSPVLEDKAGQEAVDKAELTPEVDASKVLANPFFYKVEGPDGASGYILGSMHMGVDAKTELPQSVWGALRESSKLVIEADITDLSLAKGMMLPEGENLEQLLGEEDWKLVEEKLGAGTAKMMATMKPSAVAASIGAKGLPVTMPMELSFIMEAQESEIELGYLESASFQLELLNKIMDLDFLRNMLKTAKDEDSLELLDLYRKGDEEALHEATLKPDAWGENFESNIEAMLYARNDDWIPKLELMFKDKKTFVAVGAAHLVGPRGVLASLRSRGYTIERVSDSP